MTIFELSAAQWKDFFDELKAIFVHHHDYPLDVTERQLSMEAFQRTIAKYKTREDDEDQS